MIEFGAIVRDRVTNFEGTATGRASYITGCDQILVQPAIDDKGTFREGRWFDKQRLEVTGQSGVEIDNSEKPGADIPAPIR